MAHEGATFVFGSVVTGNMDPLVKNFVTWILPSVIFFSALSACCIIGGFTTRRIRDGSNNETPHGLVRC
jgi:concentrative nucleoside transporter, CNT family